MTSTDPQVGDTSEISAAPAGYLRFIEIARKVVAATMAVCGVSFVVCAHRDEYLRLTLGMESGFWVWGCGVCGIGVLVCLAATLLLVVERLARPAVPTGFAARLLVRGGFLLVTVGAICFCMTLAFGPGQAIGAAGGSLLALGAVRARHIVRIAFAVSAVIVLGSTLAGTQSPYQYARRHADEIVAAGCQLMDQCPEAEFRRYNPRNPADASDAQALFGQEIQPNDPRVPPILRKLGARRIWVDKERVAVYVGSGLLDFFLFSRPEIEFQSYRAPHPHTCDNPVWGFRGKGHTKINDRLWTSEY
jgi:hypothetical protein